MNQPTGVYFDRVDQSEYLSVLSYAPAEAVKSFAAALLPNFTPVEVLGKRSELVTLPYFQGDDFELGEVLITEVHLQTADGTEGFGAAIGTDDEHALSIALLDAALTAGQFVEKVMAFVDAQALLLAEADA